MSNTNVYLKCQRSVQVSDEDVYLKDICSLRCADHTISARLKCIKVHKFGEKKPTRHVISTLRLIELMEEECPDISVEVIGETDVLLEYQVAKKHSAFVALLKIAFVCFVSFLGTAFTIMAYHNDIGINAIFDEIYRILLNERPKGVNALEISYSLGVTMGMLLFFNHSGGKTITKDPTPIQVAMRNYERDVDTSLVETAQRGMMEEDNQR